MKTMSLVIEIENTKSNKTVINFLKSIREPRATYFDNKGHTVSYDFTLSTSVLLEKINRMFGNVVKVVPNC